MNKQSRQARRKAAAVGYDLLLLLLLLPAHRQCSAPPVNRLHACSFGVISTRDSEQECMCAAAAVGCVHTQCCCGVCSHQCKDGVALRPSCARVRALLLGAFSRFGLLTANFMPDTHVLTPMS